MVQLCHVLLRFLTLELVVLFPSNDFVLVLHNQSVSLVAAPHHLVNQGLQLSLSAEQTL